MHAIPSEIDFSLVFHSIRLDRVTQRVLSAVLDENPVAVTTRDGESNGNEKQESGKKSDKKSREKCQRRLEEKRQRAPARSAKKKTARNRMQHS